MIASVMFATTARVAMLPMVKIDQESEYIVKMLEIRDLQLTFNKAPRYELIDMKQTSAAVKAAKYDNLLELDKDNIISLGKSLGADIVVRGSVESMDGRNFKVMMDVFSMRTGDLRNINFTVTKNKTERWASLDENFMKQLDVIMTGEITKLLIIARQNFQDRKSTDALEMYRKIIAADPNNVEALTYIGYIYYEEKDYAQAEENFKKALALDPNNEDCLRSITQVYKDQNKIDLALDSWTKLATIKNTADLWLSAATLYNDNHQGDKAKEALLKAITIDPDNLVAKRMLAFQLVDEQQYAEAIPYLVQLSNSDQYSDDDMITRRLAQCYQKTGKIADAIAQYEQVKVKNPNNERAFLNLAGIYRSAAAAAAENGKQGEATTFNQKALSTLQEMKAFSPQNATMYLRMADIYISTNRFAEAEVAANNSVKYNPDLYASYLILSQVYQKRGSDSYNLFADLENQSQKLVGKKADDVKKQKESVKNSAYTSFKKAEDLLITAKSKSSEQSVIRDINDRIAKLQPLLKATSKSFF